MLFSASLVLALIMGSASAIHAQRPALPSAAAVPSAAAGNPVMIVTSDSSAYCRTLSDEVGTHSSVPREVQDLKVEGDGMCQDGQVRAGLARLRRALLILRRTPASSDPTSP